MALHDVYLRLFDLARERKMSARSVFNFVNVQFFQFCSIDRLNRVELSRTGLTLSRQSREGARRDRAPCHWPPSAAIFNRFRGGEGCSTGPHVLSNPMHDPIAPHAKDTTNQGSVPLVFARRHSDCIPLLLCLASGLALAFTAHFLGHRWCLVQNLIQGNVCGIRSWHEPGVGPTLHAHGQWDLGALRERCP